MMEGAGLENVEDVYSLSPMQQGMMFHTIADPISGVFVNQISIELIGDLDIRVFQAVWADLVHRHSVLRTAFLWDGLDEPLQVVRQHAELEWAIHDWASLPPGEQRARLDEALEADRHRGFDLAVAPLTRMMLIRTGEASWRWVWSMHHLVADGWSAQIVLDELFILYRARLRGEHVELNEPFSYRDFIERQIGHDRQGEEEYWRRCLAGFTSPHRLDVPGIPLDPELSGHRSHTVMLDAKTADELRSAARALHVTLNTVFVGAWSVLLSKWTRERDVVFGATMAGRDAGLPGIESGVGLFINTLPLRAVVAPERRLGEWLRELQKSQVAMREFEHSSLASVQRWSDIPPGEALFESIVVFENYPSSSERRGADGLVVGDTEHLEQSNYPLAVLVIPDEHLSVTFVYDSSRLASRSIERLGDQLATLLVEFARRPQARLSDFDVVPHEDALQLPTFEAGPELTPDERCVHEIIESVAIERPDAIAAMFDGRSITYGDLDRAANDVARRLRAAGVGPNRPVGLHLPRSIDMLTGMLGILKAGGAYVPLDPAYPPGHIRSLLEGDAIDVVLTNVSLRHRLPDGRTTVMIDHDELPHHVLEHDGQRAVTNEDLAYVIHTSGSTGRPKGVMVTHRNLVQSTMARIDHYGDPVGRFLLLSSFSFDSSVAGIFWTLCTGGTLVLPTPNLEQDMDRLVALAEDCEITHLLCLPALYKLLLEHADHSELTTLKVAIVAGEACPPGILEAHLRRVPHGDLHNEYGPTEATVWCTAHRATAADVGRALPIGRPIPGTTIHLLDEQGHRVPIGFPGEVCVSGPGISRGYLNRPDLTAERFVTVSIDGQPVRIYRTGDLASFRDDGTLLYLGRADRQLKIRGHRIEASAVEAVLQDHPTVGGAAVAGRAASGRGVLQLVGYVVPVDEGFEAAQLHRDLATMLPPFMVPDVIVSLDELPRLPNGKIDYTALPSPRAGDSGRSDDFVAPRNEVEATLAAIWVDLLDLESVGIHDDFFAVGGDSIVSIQMISRARQAGIRIEPGQIATNPTIERLAAAATVAREAPDQKPVTGPVPLGPIQQWFFEVDLEVPSHWNQSVLFEVPPTIDESALRRALQECIDHHDMLRARFERAEGGWLQTVDASHAVSLRSVDVADDNVQSHVAVAQATLDLENGPVLRGLLLRVTETGRSFLLLAVHHLVIDAVSWGVLAADLEAAYAMAVDRRPLRLPPRTTSYRDWILRLAAEDRSDERAFWSASIPTTRVPRDRSNPDNGSEATTKVFHTELDATSTRHLLTDAHEAYQTRPEDLLVAALAAVLADWIDADAVRIALEGHGRPDDVEGVDLSRTVGWFTAYYPATLDVVRARGDGDVIKSIKEQLRAVPRGGIGYGALRYIDGHEDLADQPNPEILFNYLSRVRNLGGEGPFTMISAAETTSRADRNARLHALEVVAAVGNERLGVDWYYSDAVHEAATIAHLADGFLEILRRFIDHCLGDEAGGFTPSDFPEAGLDQAELDRFLDEIA